MASQPAAGMPGIEVPSFVWDYHAYKDIWEPENGEMLELKWERENCKDIKCGRGCERRPYCRPHTEESCSTFFVLFSLGLQ